MKKIISIIALICFVTPFSFCQVKVLKATHQKMFGGMGGITMHYTIDLKSKAEVKIDSVKSIADTLKVDFQFNKNEKGIYEIAFLQALKQPEKCKTCIDTTPKNANLTKGVMIYYKKGEKKLSHKVKKFKQLADLMMP